MRSFPDRKPPTRDFLSPWSGSGDRCESVTCAFTTKRLKASKETFVTLPQPVGNQIKVAYRPSRGHQVVLGSAGTGKTVMAVLRSQYLSNPKVEGTGRTLLVTSAKALAGHLKHMSGGGSECLDVRTYGHFARGYLNSRGLMRSRNIVPSGMRKNFVGRAIRSVAENHPGHRLFERDVEWFADELSWITGMGFQTENAYLEAERRRRDRIIEKSRPIVWEVLERYRELRDEQGYDFDWDDIATTVRKELTVDDHPRFYRHVVIDEGQDLTPEEIRSLADAVPPDGSVTFFGDYAQQIYGQAMSWKSCGLQVRKVEKFQDNYRNSAAIAKVAIALSSGPFFGAGGPRRTRRAECGWPPSRSGEVPGRAGGDRCSPKDRASAQYGRNRRRHRSYLGGDRTDLPGTQVARHQKDHLSLERALGCVPIHLLLGEGAGVRLGDHPLLWGRLHAE